MSSPKIPLKIHQIWIGPAKLPEKFIWMMDTWKTKNPNFEYRLWTNEDIEAFGLENKDLFEKVSNWGAKSDIFRYEILYRYGGIYIDVDFECLTSLEPLHCKFEFYSCLIPTTSVAANGVIGSCSGHPILRDCIDKLKSVDLVNSNDYFEIMMKLGPYFLTDSIIRFLDRSSSEFVHDKVLILGSKYFFPFPSNLRFDYRKGLISRSKILSFVKSESYAIHYWANSWQE